MTTFFPHLYEYSKFISLAKEYEKIDEHQTQIQRKRHFADSKYAEQKPIKYLTLSKNTLSFNQCRQSSDIDFLIYLEIKAQKLRESSYNPLKYYNVSINEILKERTELANFNRYQKPADWPQSSSIIHISEYKHKCFSTSRHWMIIDFILCVEIAKILPFFDKLNIDDKQELLKSTTLLNSLFTQAYYSFTVSCDALIFPDGSVPCMFTQKHNIQSGFFEEIVEPIKRIKMTKEEYVLLKTMIFCSSKSEFISVEGSKIIESEFHRYSKLLLNFLQAKYGDSEGAVRYSQILSVLEAMIYFTQKAKEFYFYVGTLNTNFRQHSTFALVKQLIN
uniref:NR LBD domain-containing protein n=1 Tax=Panagrolaimus sp. ES5 TaxID=591445 RepID=A0AC34F7S0_9BILA